MSLRRKGGVSLKERVAVSSHLCPHRYVSSSPRGSLSEWSQSQPLIGQCCSRAAIITGPLRSKNRAKGCLLPRIDLWRIWRGFENDQHKTVVMRIGDLQCLFARLTLSIRKCLELRSLTIKKMIKMSFKLCQQNLKLLKNFNQPCFSHR